MYFNNLIGIKAFTKDRLLGVLGNVHNKGETTLMDGQSVSQIISQTIDPLYCSPRHLTCELLNLGSQLFTVHRPFSLNLNKRYIPICVFI